MKAKFTALAAGLTASIPAIHSEATACSIIYEPKPYAEVLAELHRPELLEHVNDASAIYIARMASSEKSSSPLAEDRYDDQLYYPSKYQFSVHEVIKGMDIDTFAYKSKSGDNNFIAIPLYGEEGDIVMDSEASLTLDPLSEAEFRHSSFGFWIRSQLNIGEAAGAGDCLDYVYFEPDADYLFVLDDEGRTQSAERIAGGENDPWLTAVRYVIAQPDAEAVGVTTLKDALSLFSLMQRVKVERCGPSPAISEKILPDGMRKLTEPTKMSWFDEGDDPYIEYPFEESDCLVGMEFLVINFDQWFDLDVTGVIDFTDLAFEKHIVGPRTALFSDVLKWAGYAE
ncbi:hypothetical protein [Parvularcula marina]|uniref:hypothetical protein n=1 Tax=Parvularcula marina TaxID=2292771 RepID=UPI0035177614